MTRTIRVLNGLKKTGFHSGRLHANNIISGTVDVTLGSGDGTATVTFAKPLNNATYRVLLCPQEATTNDDLTLSVTTKTPKSFVINVYSTDHTSPITIGFLVLANHMDNVADSNSRFGFHSGHAYFKNLQWGKAEVAISGGAGTDKIITFKKPMNNKPLIFLSFDDDTAVTAGFAYIGAVQTNGKFTIDVTAVAGPSTTVDITWLAFDPGFNFGTTDAVAHKNVTDQNKQGKFGIHSGNFRAKNFLGGFNVDTTDASGDGTDAVTYGSMMKNTPVVFVGIQSPVDDITGIAYASTITIAGHTVGVNNSNTTSTALYYGWLAIDHEFRATNAAE